MQDIWDVAVVGAGPAGAAAARAAAWSAGQASGVAHMGAHALGAAAYAVKTVTLAAPDVEGAAAGGAAEIAWQLRHLSPPVRTTLARLPLLGEDSSGPLGTGLLASGALGEAIRTLQAGPR